MSEDEYDAYAEYLKEIADDGTGLEIDEQDEYYADGEQDEGFFGTEEYGGGEYGMCEDNEDDENSEIKALGDKIGGIGGGQAATT